MLQEEKEQVWPKGRPKGRFVTQGLHPWSPLVAPVHSWSPLVTPGHPWSLLVTRGHHYLLQVLKEEQEKLARRGGLSAASSAAAMNFKEVQADKLK